MRANSVARRYAQATFDVAREVGDPQGWLIQLQAVASATSEPELAASLRSPNIPEAVKAKAVEQVFPDLPAELRNLVNLLVARNRIDILPGLCVAFEEYLDELLGRTDAEVISARPLGADELLAIQNHLNRRTGRTVKLHTSVDKSILGGVTMRVGDEVVDGSVATRLERLRQRLV